MKLKRIISSIVTGLAAIMAGLVALVVWDYYLPGIEALEEAEGFYNRPLHFENRRGENYRQAFWKVREAKEYFQKGHILFLFDYKLEEDIGTVLIENKLQLVEVLLASANDPEEINEALENVIKELYYGLKLSPFPANKITIIRLRRRIGELEIKRKLEEASRLINEKQWSEVSWVLNDVDSMLVFNFDLYDFHRSGDRENDYDRFFYPAQYKRLRMALEAEEKRKK